MRQLQIFTPANGIYAGVNTPQFTQLEYVTEMAKKANKKLPNLGLFGEASTGKTTTVGLLANSLPNTSVIYVNSAGLTAKKLVSLIVAEIKALIPKGDIRFWGENVFYVDPDKKCYKACVNKFIIFLDEAQSLPSDLQTLLLSTFDRMADPTVDHVFEANIPTLSFDLDMVSFVLATTDTSKILYPLTTRLTSVTFDQYTKDDVKNIIGLKYSYIDDGARGILANCSKLVPRVALRLAEQISTFHGRTAIMETQAADFAKNFLNMEENGIDAIDKRILLYLSNHKKKIDPVDIISLEMNKKIKSRLENKSSLTPGEHKELNRAIFQEAVLEQKVSLAEFTPKSRQDISLACRILDLKDLETRLTFLENLSLVEKSPKGIMLNEKYL